jgi:hypothetical protein
MDCVAEILCKTVAHVYDRVEAEGVKISICYPELVDVDEREESRRLREGVDVVLVECDVWEIEEVSVEVFGICVPVLNLTFSGEGFVAVL